jgi:hypothetical protein
MIVVSFYFCLGMILFLFYTFLRETCKTKTKPQPQFSYPRLGDVLNYIKDRAKLNDQLFQYCPYERQSHLGKLFDGKLFRGNIYFAILSIAEFSEENCTGTIRYHKDFIANQYHDMVEDLTEDKTLKEFLADMLERWEQGDDFIEECKIIH